MVLFNRKIVMFLTLLSVFCLPSKIKALDYSIKKYDIDIVVNENNTFDITETIDAYFYQSKHGIFREIPLKNEIVRLDGTTSKNKTKISNLYVNNDYTTYKENNNYVIKIGSSDLTVTGLQNYVIKYNYNIGKDPLKDKDELYFNIIGTGWDTIISNVTFKITMPKEFDSKSLGFSHGRIGSTDSSNIEYEVKGNVITGSYNGTLFEGDGLTVRLELPEGYFVGEKTPLNIGEFLIIFIPLISLIISLLLWLKYGKDDKLVDTVEFYPPNQLNSLELGYLYKGKSDKYDVISLLIYLASKGYVKISEITDENDDNSFVITKLKEYDGSNETEKEFLSGLFLNSDEVNENDLYNSFYLTIDKILNIINSRTNKKTIFKSNAIYSSIITIMMIIISIFTILLIPLYDYVGDSTFKEILTIAFALSPAIIMGLGIKNANWLIRLIFIGFYVLGICIFMVGNLGLDLRKIFDNNFYLMGFISGIPCIIGMIYCYKYMPKRTKYGNEILGKILGFKNFLETVEKEKLEAMVKNNPNYFYDILPYTYVLGISNLWISKFETISLKAPEWYDGYSTFDTNTISNFMHETMTHVEKTMTSYPQSSYSGGSDSFSSGSDFSGGGSSGGGSGGGGGGSW